MQHCSCDYSSHETLLRGSLLQTLLVDAKALRSQKRADVRRANGVEHEHLLVAKVLALFFSVRKKITYRHVIRDLGKQVKKILGGTLIKKGKTMVIIQSLQGRL